MSLNVSGTETAQDPGAVVPPHAVILSSPDCIHHSCFFTSMATLPFGGFSQEEVTEGDVVAEVMLAAWSMPVRAFSLDSHV